MATGGKRKQKLDMEKHSMIPVKVGDTAKPSRSQRIRTLMLLVFLQLCFVFLIYRSFSLQCIQGDELRRMAADQRSRKIRIKAKRGNIYDRNLQPLAVELSSYSLYADPSDLEHRKSAVRSLSSTLDVSEEEILRRLRTTGRHFVWLKRQLPDQVANKVESLGIRGLAFEEEEKRFYPKDSLAAHVIGFVGLDNIGLDGIEKAYDPYMRGNFQELVSQNDRKGRDLTPREIGYDEPTRGYDVVLTIDEVIQHIAEEELRQACEKWQAKSGSVIIMNPKTGEILALANHPTYDLNQAFSSSGYYRRNRAIRDLYEPGSAFKIVTAAAVINENLVTMEERIDCENGTCQFDGYTIHDPGRYGKLTFSEVVERSSNIGMVKVASRLGSRRLYSYIEAFGLTGKTGVDLSERAGFVRPPERWTKRSMAAIPFGHEIAITPLQMLCSTNAVANNGVIMKPFIVRAIIRQDARHETQDMRHETRDRRSEVSSLKSQASSLESIIEFSPQRIRTPISSRTARIMKGILIRAVENGTGKNAKIHGCKVAGKTGTAQKASSEGGYLPGKYVSSFTGFLPAENPVISVIVVIDEPQGSYTGGAVACPVFREIATQVMQYLTVGQRFKAF
jgi:cell division protein FtsI/penicillin-binding protein 2